MVSEFSPAAVAARLRSILGTSDRGTARGAVEAIARRLGVSEVALRISIDDREPHPAMEVLVAVVRHHGIDPTWLLTGEYDRATHRAALEDAPHSSSELAALIAKQLTPPAGAQGAPVPQAVQRGNLRLEA